MTLNLKIEVLKVLSLELNFSSDNKPKKDNASEKDSKPAPSTPSK